MKSKNQNFKSQKHMEILCFIICKAIHMEVSVFIRTDAINVRRLSVRPQESIGSFFLWLAFEPQPVQ